MLTVSAKDDQISRLREAFEVLFNYSPTGTSKLARGMEWRLNPEDGFKTIYTVMLDIVGYSVEDAAKQKQLVQKLSRVVGDAVRAQRKGADEVQYISTGDGMIIVFEDHPEKMLAIVFSIQDGLKQVKRSENIDVRVRTGLHSGPIFRYTDINGNLNCAGSGINLAQRVMSMGDAGHILATEDAYKTMGECFADYKAYFHNVGEREVKHGEKIKVFNVYDVDGHHGNPNVVT